VISGNNAGVLVSGSTTQALIAGNKIGYAADGTTVLGNTGSAVSFGALTGGNQVGGSIGPNQIAYMSGQSGVNIASTTNLASENSGSGDPTQWILSTLPAPSVTNLGGGKYKFTLTGAQPNQTYSLEFYSDGPIVFLSAGQAMTDASGNSARSRHSRSRPAGSRAELRPARRPAHRDSDASTPRRHARAAAGAGGAGGR
jgi:hypothetical protein